MYMNYEMNVFVHIILCIDVAMHEYQTNYNIQIK